MTENPNPSVRSRQVANLLRELREDRGLSGAEVAKQLAMSASKISRIETGNRMLSVDVVAALLGLYKVPERQRDQILDQVRNYEALVMPGLLQTAEYTGVIIKAVNQGNRRGCAAPAHRGQWRDA